ncbi:MAG: metallophosphoesterase [Candidatus Solibacter usitatus]|nr:metallophosphoesterase [Candidatus Solibacter usitatus]
MKALIFSDIHGDLRALERLMAVEADLYFAAGDLVTWARGLERMGKTLQARAGRVYVLPGNHESAAQISAFCSEFGFEDFHQKTMEAGKFRIAGLGYSSPTPFNTPGEYTEEQIARHLSRFAGLDPLVLICHAPPFGTDLDRVRQGLHAGSKSVLSFLETHQPAWFFCGHIHEAEGARIQIGRTTAINVGKQGYLLEL